METEQTPKEEPNKWWKKLYNAIKGIIKPDIVGLIALGLSSLATCNDCADREQTERHHQEQVGLSFHPNLDIIKVEFVSSKMKVDLSTPIQEIPSNDGYIDLPATLEVKFRFFVHNSGNARAVNISYFFTDTTSGDLILHNIFHDPKRQIDLTELSKGYYSRDQLDSGDTIKYWPTYQVQFYKDSTFTIHALFLYENEAGQVFETYYRERYVTYPIPLDNLTINKPVNFDIAKFLRSVDKSTNYRMYTKQEGESLYDLIEKRLGSKE